MNRKLIAAFFLCYFTGLSSVFAGQVTTFIYHRFDEHRYPSTNISSDVFIQQLNYLKEHQVTVVSLTGVAEKIASGQTLPDEAIALCADDAYRSFYEVAFPLLKKYRYPATLFVNTDAVGSNGYMTWAEVAEISAAGIEIGNHTASHLYLVEAEEGELFDAWQKRIKDDILKAQETIEAHIGVRPRLFAYTFGEYSDAVVEVAREIGFLAAYAQQSGVIHDQSPLFNLPRFPMGEPYATLDGFIDKSKMLPLVVSEQIPFDPVVTDNPPLLEIRVENGIHNPKRYNCFVQGDNRCRVEALKDKGDGWLQVRAEKPLSGRRNKYTLTVQNSEGRWLWFSQPWLNASRVALPQQTSDSN